MATTERFFLEWKEQYVSKERGNRVVHYFLKDSSGQLILAVVGTERSVRHMFYVVSEEFLNAYAGADSSVQAGFRWRSRREVVNWLTSMLSNQRRRGDSSISPKENPGFEINPQLTKMPSHKGRLPGNLKGHYLGISWSGSTWTCGKQLKHYPAFCRNGISIAVQSFVSVMAENENRYIAYLEDMYEDRKCQKKVKVRWFHHNREVEGVVPSRNPHPKEVFITPYVQVISAECVDSPAIVLTREHYDKCLSVFPPDLLDRVHFCFRQYKTNGTKPFKLNKLRGYFHQPIFSCFSPDFFDEKEVSSEDDDVKVPAKRSRSSGEFDKSRYDLSYKKYGLTDGEPKFLKNVKGRLRHAPIFSANEKVEFLCQDSGLRGCWFRCTVLEVSRRQMKILYDDVKDEDSCTNLEEWIPTYRVANADKLGMRHAGRPTVRPPYCSNQTTGLSFKVGDPADAWWSDGWWEGIISVTSDAKNRSYQIYIPGENFYLDMELENLRVSKDWVGDGGWVDIEPNTNILGVISAKSIDTRPATLSDLSKESKLCSVDEEIRELAGMTLTNVPLEEDRINNEKEYKSNHVNGEEENNVDADYNLVECEIAEMKCEAGEMEMLTES